MSNVSPIPFSSRYNYHTIFSDICKTRFNHLATRLLLTVTVCVTLAAALASKRHHTAIEYLLVLPLKWVLLYVALLLLIITRKNYLHVNFLGYSNLFTHVNGQLFSLRTVVYQIIHSLSSILIALSIQDCIFYEFDLSSLTYYRLHTWVLIPLLYTLQHSIFDLDRLPFDYGAQHQHPQQYVSNRVKNSLIKCCFLTAILFVVSPFCFFTLTSRWSSGFATHLKCSLLSLFIFQFWDFTNVCFNAYLSIGCLHKGKPISSLSSTPMETLVTGLNSKRLFTKLTAFQELSYRATSSDIQLRLPIYHTRYRNSFIWPSILRECLLVIQKTNTSVSNFLKNLELKNETAKKYEAPIPGDLGSMDNDTLFGNKHTVTNGFNTRLPGSPPSSSEMSHRITLQNNSVFIDNKLQPQTIQFSSLSHSYDSPILTNSTAVSTVITELSNKLKNFVKSFFFPSAAGTQKNCAQQLSFFELWNISKERQAEKLVPLPVCYAECTISLMGLLINSLEEDPKGGVVSSVGEVLKILERSVGALGGFAEWGNKVSSSHYRSNTVTNYDNVTTADTGYVEETPDLITILYDLSINAFLEVVLKYNELLNDVYLDEDVVKLSKWVLEMCNE